MGKEYMIMKIREQWRYDEGALEELSEEEVQIIFNQLTDWEWFC